MITIGSYVKLTDNNIEGFVTEVSNKYISVLFKDKIIKVLLDKAQETTKNELVKKQISSSVKVNVILSSPPVDEIMIRHQTVDEALMNLDKFIDNAICNNVKIVKIIHGKNGGILRKEVHKYLENSPFVKEHRLGGYYEGSYGVTIAFLK